MKKLIYIWVNNYRKLITWQGYQLSPEVLVYPKVISEKDGNASTVSLRMTDNTKNTIQNFYGENIVSLTAFVGKNGSGKTTLSRMLLEYLPDGVLSTGSLEALKALNHIRSDLSWDERCFYILYDDEQHAVTVCLNDVEVEIEDTTDHLKVNIEHESYGEMVAAVRSGIYLTNVFNPGEMLESYHKLNLENDKTTFQQSYSPAFLLKYEAEERTKNLYGYRIDDKYISFIQEYAKSQTNFGFLSYLNKQAELFIDSYNQIPDSFKQEMRIYREFDLYVISFGRAEEIASYMNEDFSDYNERFGRLGPRQQHLVRLKRCFLFQEYYNPDILTKLYINMLLEVYGVFLDPSSQEAKNVEIIFAKEIAKADEKTLESIRESLRKGPYKETGWAKQILDFIGFLTDGESFEEKRKWMGKTGNHKFTETKLINWFYREIKKENSFVKRNLAFRWRPTSSGEMAAANLFSYLDHAVSNLDRHGGSGENPDGIKRNVLVIFDELDCYLHPKWQQRIVGMLLEKLRGYDKFNFQVVITSHSPIILSDICKENILKIENFRAQMSEKRTFGADISMLYYDSFFMDEGDIGNFAKKNIQYVAEQLNRGCLDEEDKLLYIIENIGQDLIRQKLKNRYLAVRKKQRADAQTNAVNLLNQMDPKDREKVIRYMKQLQAQHAEETADDKT